MDEMYHAKLVGDLPRGHHSPGDHHPFDTGTPLQHRPPQQFEHQIPPQPVPVQLPNIYVNPYPPVSHPPQPAQRNDPLPNIPSSKPTDTTKIRVGSWEMRQPHPLLWVCLALSFLALVLEVPKGSLPTITGRHQALRTREKVLNERLQLLNQLSTFLPPPLSKLITQSEQGNTPYIQEQFGALPGLKYWNTNPGTQRNMGVEGGRWWSVEELGQGASVVRSRGAEGEGEREVWVLRVEDGEEGHEDKTILNALTHSLLLRDRLLAELTDLKTKPCPPCPPCSEFQKEPKPQCIPSTSLSIDTHPEHGQLVAKNQNERERIDDKHRRDKEREKEVEEREREVGRREKWVVDEMRKLSDKVHSQATELTLEDRITERLKAYQRQLTAVRESNDEL